MFGRLKHNWGFRRFMLWGLEKVKIELGLLCTAHDMARLAAQTPPVCLFLTPTPSYQGLSPAPCRVLLGQPLRDMWLVPMAENVRRQAAQVVIDTSPVLAVEFGRQVIEGLAIEELPAGIPPSHKGKTVMVKCVVMR